MRLLNLPNCLSLARPVLAVPLAWALVHERAALAVAVFTLVVVTDLLDGRIARQRGQSSRIGTLLDHGSDAVFVVSLSSVGVALGLLPVALPILIAVAFMQYLVDSRVASGRSLRHSQLGRYNGIAYFVVVGACLAVHLFLREPYAVDALHGFAWLLAASTLVSIGDRLRASRGV